VTFRNPEVFIDLPQGERRTADVVATVRSLEEEPELVIVHVEIQRDREPHFGHRMFQFYVALRQRENKPVIPIALVFYTGREDIAREEYEEAVFGESILTFRYLHISLPLLRAEDYVQAEQVLGAGLASVMRLPGDRQAQIRLRLACLRRLHDAERGGGEGAVLVITLIGDPINRVGGCVCPWAHGCGGCAHMAHSGKPLEPIWVVAIEPEVV
jgi:hypothetical protein